MEIFIQSFVTRSAKKLLGKNSAEIHCAGTNLIIPFLSDDENCSIAEKYSVKIKNIKEDILSIKNSTKSVIIRKGEPCLQRLALKSILKEIKNNGMKIAIETYGTRPNTLEEFIKDKLVDIVVLKAYFPLQETWLKKINKGKLVSDNKEIISNILKSIKILQLNNIKTHIKIIIVPSFLSRVTDVVKIIKNLKPITNSIIELIPFDPKESNKNYTHIKPPTEEFMDELKLQLQSEFPMLNFK
jgi:pyruvate-formate lyase-activating enzyme